jgi:DinB family protein/SCP-2 sterol transfer family protein
MAGTTIEIRTDIGVLAKDLDDIWALIDLLLDSVPADAWTRRYGPDWTYADVPWHLAYFDRIMLAEVLESGADLPEPQRFNLRTMAEINRWNAQEFAARPAGQTPQDSIRALRAVHDRIRGTLASLTDADLDRPAFNHFFSAGFETVRSALRGGLLHSWGEATELMTRPGRHDPVPEAATRNAVEGYLTFMAASADASRTGDRPFVLVMDFTGPGGSPYAVRVEKGKGRVVPGRPQDASLTFRLDPVAFNTVMIRRMQNPMLAMLTGKIRVKGLSKMPLMQKVFSPPSPDKQLKGSLYGG